MQLAGSDAQKQEILPKVASGELVMTLAFTEPSARFDAEGVELRAEAQGDGYVLNGTKLFIPDAHVADKMVVVARTGGSGEDGITLFLVDGKATGLTSTVLKTIAADKQCEVKFEDVAVGADAVLGEVGGGWATMQQLQRRATVAYCAYLVGLAQRDFEISVDYAKERIQFGRPIGSFQAIQHKAADMVTDVDGSRFIMYRAAWAVNEDEADQDLQVSMAKGLVLRREPPGGRARAADPRRHRLHEGVHHPALLPPAEDGRADVGRRRVPSREGRGPAGDLAPLKRVGGGVATRCGSPGIARASRRPGQAG